MRLYLLVSYTDNPVEYKTALNNYLVGLTDCEYIYCDKSQVPETIRQVMDISDKDTTTFIWGAVNRCKEFILIMMQYEN